MLPRKEPALQLTQPTDPVAAAYLPAPHGEHGCVPDTDQLPASQGVILTQPVEPVAGAKKKAPWVEHAVHAIAPAAEK